MPDFSHEETLTGLVAGVDEVGRGPLAGPVVAAAVVFLKPPPKKLASKIDDSKKLSAAARAEVFAALLKSNAVIAIAAASVAEIERLNILHASMLAMQRAVARLGVTPDWALVDGNRAPKLACRSHCLVGGDALSLSIAAASIVAKVTRDRGMALLDRRWPGYGFAQHAGYATALHREAIERLGPTPHHRMGFGTLKNFTLNLSDA